MKGKFYLIIALLIWFFNSSFSQNLVEIPPNEWQIQNYTGSCYHDTIIHAVWVKILPERGLKRYKNDDSFAIVELELVNKSPIDIYVSGMQNKLMTIVMKETYVLDTSIKSKFPVGTMHRKMERKNAFEMEDLKSNPHKDLMSRENEKEVIRIKSGSKKILIAAIPKRNGDYRIEVPVYFTKNKTFFDCYGVESSWRENLIESNKIELRKVIE